MKYLRRCDGSRSSNFNFPVADSLDVTIILSRGGSTIVIKTFVSVSPADPTPQHRKQDFNANSQQRQAMECRMTGVVPQEFMKQQTDETQQDDDEEPKLSNELRQVVDA